MSQPSIAPPVADEYAPFYSGYVALAREQDPLALLRSQRDSLRAMCASLTEEQALARYAPGKWSIKEVLAAWGGALETEGGGAASALPASCASA